MLLPNASGGLLMRVLATDVDGARGMLTAIAGSVITVTGLVFSLMVVSLQLASQQFSPRLLRTFMRDIGTQIVLGVFLATFAYSLAVLRAVGGGADPLVPQVAVAGAFLLALASVAALVYFVHHSTMEIRIDTMMRDVERDTRTTIDYVYPHRIGESHPLREPLQPPPAAALVPAQQGGFIQDVDLEELGAVAARHDVFVAVHPAVGDYVIEGARLLWVWGPRDGAPSNEAVAAVEQAGHAAVQIGHERTHQGDVGFGLRQLADVAVKALSPAINDPTTAVHAVNRLSALLWILAGRRLEPVAAYDRDGVIRATLPSRGFEEYLDLACGQIRRYGASEPAVTSALLEMLAVVAAAADEHECAAIRSEAQLVLEAARETTAQKADLRPVEDAWEKVERALAGDHRP